MSPRASICSRTGNTIPAPADILRKALVALCAAALWTGAALSQTLELSLPSGARSTAEIRTSPDTFALPVGPFTDGVLPVLEVSGTVIRRAWQIPAQGLTTLQVLTPLREQILATGFAPLYECADRVCGGFDFRYAADILEAPAMHVDLFDYRVLSARRDTELGPFHTMLLVSRTATLAYVQLVLITPEGVGGLDINRDETPAEPPKDDDPAPRPVTDAGPLADQLEGNGHAILGDLEFETGSSTLSDKSYASLQALASYLKDRPDRRVALVGHTDTQGSLEGNIGLSRRRAQSVLDRLVSRYGVPGAQLDAEGMGYLAPVASNLTEAGREANRRVEAVLLNTK